MGKRFIAVVGSRTFKNFNLIDEWFSIQLLKKDFKENTVIVSGGAVGVDSYAIEMAKKYGIEYIEFKPDLKNCKFKYEYTQAYYKRNQQIVDQSDYLVAFVNSTKGGTWDTIRRAQLKKIRMEIKKEAT